MKMTLFGKRIPPACGYCEWGTPDGDDTMVFCPNNGVVSPAFSCRKFRYAPLKRKPKLTPPLPKYNPEEFKLTD